MQHDLNLLFGVLAVQLRKVSSSQLMEAAAAWATDPALDLGKKLVDRGDLSQRDRGLISALVKEAVAVHDGKAESTLSSLGGEEALMHSFGSTFALNQATGRTVPMAVSAQRTTESRGEREVIKAVDECPSRYSQPRNHGRGGMGRVLTVLDEHLGRTIALKELLIPPDAESVSSPSGSSIPLSSRFIQEARITGQLEHPSIVPVYELGRRSSGSLYYTMKLVRGQTLRQAVRSAAALGDRIALLPHFVDLCQAIAYAHSRGVIHRDIKPHNVMVGEFGETVVIDWGLAKARDREDIYAAELEKTFHALQLGDEAEIARTSVGQALGTPSYMPPEQARGDIPQIDERSDVYSLGAVLYELITGVCPFRGKTVRQVLDQVIATEPERVDAIEPDVPPELAAICERAMQKEPSGRYPSAGALATEVQRFLSGALVETYRYDFMEHLVHFVRRHRAVVMTAAAFLMVLVVVMAGSVEWNRRARKKAEQAAARAEQEKQRAQLVSDFVTGLFKTLDPGEGGARALNALEMLEQGRAGIERDLGSQPLDQARLMGTVGDLYRKLGLNAQAEPLLVQSLSIREEKLPKHSLDVATSLFDLARLYRTLSRFEEAEPLLKRCLEIRKHELGPEHPEVASTLSSLATLYRQNGAFAQAETLYRQSLDIRKRQLGDDHPDVAKSLSAFAGLYLDGGELDKAEELLERARAIREQSLPDNHPLLADTLARLAYVHYRRKELGTAEDLYRRALGIREKSLGPDHPHVAEVLTYLGDILARQHRLEEAESVLSRGLQIRLQAFGDSHRYVAVSYDSLAVFNLYRKDLAAAEELFERSLEIRQKELPNEHPHIVANLLNLARVQMKLQRYHKAEQLCRRALASQEKALKDNDPRLATTLKLLADALQQSGSPDEAESLRARAASIDAQATEE